MRTYYFPNSSTNDLVFTDTPPDYLKKKIDKLCHFNAWTTLGFQEDNKIDFMDRLYGYHENNECFDNSYALYKKDVSNYEEKQNAKIQELEKFTTKIDKCNTILENLLSRCKKLRESNNDIKKINVILDRGYIKVQQRVSGSKRGRRYKKNADCRYLTDVEIKKYKNKIQELQSLSEALVTEIKYETTLENFLFTLGNLPENVENYANVLNKKFLNYGDTIFKFSILNDTIQKLDKDIYKISIEKYKEVLKVDEEEKVQTRKKTRNKTNVYIDDDGNEIEIKEQTEQIIYNLK